MQGPGEREQLSLAHREVHAALAHVFLEAAGEALEHPSAAHFAQRPLGLAHLTFTRAESQVLPHRAREQEHVLQHEPDLSPLRFTLDLPNILPIDPDLSSLELVE